MNYKMVIAFCLVMLVLTSSLTAMAVFKDVKSDAYYYEPVEWAVANRITTGTSVDTFSPDCICTRAQFVTFLWRYFDMPDVTITNEFSDVRATDYYVKAVAWAVSKNVTNGTGNGKFSPDEPLTRAQAITMLWRLENQPVASIANPFVDTRFGAYYTDAVLWAYSVGITEGLDAIHFGPNDLCIRGQMITLLYRFHKSDKTTQVHFGDVGRFYIKYHSVALYDTLSQSVCDEWDSACYKVWHDKILILDHNGQGFNIIKTCKPGDTCYVLHEDGSKDEFVCMRVELNGFNTRMDIVDSDGVSVFDSEYDMITATCNSGGGGHVTIVYWNKI